MKTVSPGTVTGTLQAPPSKSMAQRAIAAASLLDGSSHIVMGTPCDDTRSAIRAATALGAAVTATSDGVTIRGKVSPPAEAMDCGEGGLCLRMFSALAALQRRDITLHASGSLCFRPVDMIVSPLEALGARCSTVDGRPPVTVRGPLVGGAVTVDGTISSQFLTGLLIAAPHAQQDTIITAPRLKSVPYVRMTVDFLRSLGVTLTVSDDFETFHIPGPQQISPFSVTIAGDWSGAAFLLVAAAISGDVTVTGLNPTDEQADRRILEALVQCGANIRIGSDGIAVRQAPLKAFTFDATHCPDLFPPLVALAAYCEGTSHFLGVHRLATKESDRATALMTEFRVLGLPIEVEGDVLRVTGSPLEGGEVDSHNDHRMAMALATAAIGARESVHIRRWQSVEKSYPDFFEDLSAVGIGVT